jgi:putative phosphoribosyl transferase
MKNKLFIDRIDAVNQLINVLPLESMKSEKWIVLSASNGGMPLASVLATHLNAPIDLILTDKIFTPKNSLCEVAIITETNELVIHEELQKSFNIKLDIIFNSANSIMQNKIVNKKEHFRQGNKLTNLKNSNVLLVDEGLNTGLTMMACIKTALKAGAKSVCVAVPILPSSIVLDLESITDDLYFIKSIDHFVSIDFYYKNLENISFNDIKIKIKEENKCQ